jgi:transcriptional regulator with GAF, ATPase, and Fis domain
MATQGQGRDAEGRGRPSSSFTGGPALDDLATRLGELARSLQEEASVEHTLEGIVRAAVETVPGAAYASVTQVRNRREVQTTTGTDELVYRVDRLQYDTGQGPCLDALFEQRTVRLGDMAGEARWPAFTKGAMELGVHSMLAFQLYVADDNLGSLNLFATEPDAFSDQSEHVGLLFAAHAGIALADALKMQQLTRAMDVRDVIGQAKGILMERHRLTADQAFALLVRSSQVTNTKLVEVARYLTDTGELTGPQD